jgi:hypothetical protein
MTDHSFEPTGIVDDRGLKERRTKPGLVGYDATVPTAYTLVIYYCNRPFSEGVGIVFNRK